MEFETLKKCYKKKIVIGALAVCVIGVALTFNLTRAKYRVDKSIDLAKGTINYKIPDMRIVAVKLSEDGTNYTDTNSIPTSGYTLNNEKSMCKVYDGSTSIENAPKDNNVTIEYKEGKIDFLGITKRNTRCYLYFDKKISIDSVGDLLAKVKSEAKITAPDFSDIADTDEGVYAVEDGMYKGTSYYWRGAVINNYVKFAGFCWRIVRINGDKTIRIIYDGSICHQNGTSTIESIIATDQVYDSNYGYSEYVGYTYDIGSQRTTSGSASNLKSQTDSWFSANITGTNATKVADGKFCNDRNTASGYSWSSQPNSMFYYAGGERSGAKNENQVNPTLSCSSGDVYTLKAGAITMDEVIFAGGKWGTENNNYYLYNGQYYWTMTPSILDLFRSDYYANVFRVDSNGGFWYGDVRNTWCVRPVINLKADITFKADGDGTLDNPYVVQ